MARQIARVAVRLVEIQQQTGRTIHLDVEPEPDCLLETSAETVAFFNDWLIPIGVPLLESLGLNEADARAALFEHIRVCFDCCHFAVEFEHPADALATLRDAGIRIGRVQLSSAIRVGVPADAEGRRDLDARLRPFSDTTYLHQVVAQGAGDLRHFPDLGDALACAGSCGDEWRIHFHVPLFAHEYDRLGSTQDYVADVIRLVEDGSVTSHLEIETYTWDVLPGTLKLDLTESIAREYAWVLDTLRRTRP
jgi:hypothetical protein